MLGIGQDPMDIVADENYVWVSNGFNKLTRIPTGAGPIREFEVELAGQYQEPSRYRLWSVDWALGDSSGVLFAYVES